MHPKIPLSQRPYLLLALAWLLTRAYPLSRMEPWIYWEANEAKKLLEYGFMARAGAFIDNFYLCGHVAAPWKYNYVNHPYPMLWLDTLVYLFAGVWGVILTAGLIRLAGCLLMYAALKTFFPRPSALTGALLFILAPSSVIFSFDTNIVQLGAVLWPAALYLFGKYRPPVAMGTAFLLGGVVFLGGQIDWLACSVFPVLLCAAVAPSCDPAAGLTFRPDRRQIIAVLTGGFLSVAFFAGQIFYYTTNTSTTLSYIHGQASVENAGSLPQMYAAIAVRGMLSVGPALFLGSLAALFILVRKRTVHWLQWVAILYPLTFLAAAVFLPRYFFRERTMYEYLVAPCVILTVTALEHLGSRLAVKALLGLAVLSLAYPMFQASIPIVSETSRTMGHFMRDSTQPDEVIVTNLAAQQPPFQTWDVGSVNMVGLAADRMIRPEISTSEALLDLLRSYSATELKVVFLHDTGRPIDPALLSYLRTQAQPQPASVVLPTERPPLASRLRSYYWQKIGKHQVAAPDDAPASGHHFETYRFTLQAPSHP